MKKKCAKRNYWISVRGAIKLHPFRKSAKWSTSLKSKLANFWVLFKKLYRWKAHFLAMSSKVGALTIALQSFYINTMNKNISWVSESLAPVNGAQKIRSLDFRKVWFLQYISLDKQCNIIQLSIQNYTAYNLMIVIFWL